MSNYPGKIITNLADAGYSVLFDGTGDQLTAPNNAAFDFGTGDITIECWVYLTGTSGSIINYSNGQASNSNFAWEIYQNSATSIQATILSGATAYIATATFFTNRWVHVAGVRNGNTWNIYINGVAGGSPQNVTGVIVTSPASSTVKISGYNNATGMITGYVSNVRVNKSALYTAAFTPPTQLFPIANTSLLTCQSPTIIDAGTANSGSPFAITVNGDAKVSTFTPFAAYNSYTPELGSASPGMWSLSEMMTQSLTRRSNNYDPYFTYNTLLVHGAGANGAQNNTFLDSSTSNAGSAWPITRNGNVYQGVFTPFSLTGWSTYIDGNVNISNPAGLPTAFAGWGGRTRTFELWLFRENVSAGVNLQTAYAAVAANGRWTITINASNQLDFGWTNSTSTQENIQSVSTIPAGVWTHIALVVDSTSSSNTTIRMFINGAMETFTGKNLSTQTSSFGWQSLFGYADYTYAAPIGYFSNLRWSNNLRYTTSFAPPTANFVNDANTLYLISQDYRFKDNSSNNYDVTTAAGAPKIMPFGPFNVNATTAYKNTTIGGSGYFPGNSSSHLVTTSSSTNFIPPTSTTAFTIECWVYNTGTSSTILYAAIAAENYAYTLGFGSAVGTYNSTQTPWFGFFSGSWSGIRSTTAIPLNAWTHIACVFTGATCYLYQDGVLRASGGPTTWGVTSTSKVRIGCRPDATTDVFTGYISDARVVIGTNLYPSGTTFTPPTAPLSNITNTRLLLNFTNAAVIDNTCTNLIDTVSQGQIGTAQSKFNRGSLYAGNTGSGGFKVLGQGLDVSFGNADFTIEFYIYLPTLGVNLFDTCPNGNSTPTNRILLRVLSDGTLQYATYQAVTILIASSAGAISANRWHHVALCKFNSQTRLFANGIQVGSTYADTLTYPAQFERPIIFANGFNESYGTDSYMDELRITRGYARYRTNFNPQSSRWQDQ
jgi:hypothetical protein